MIRNPVQVLVFVRAYLASWAALLGLAGALSAQSSHLLVINGVGGEPKYTQQFHQWATALMNGAVERHGVPRANVVYLTEKPEPPANRSTRENVERAFSELAARSSAGDAVLVVLIGHGSAEGGEPRLNLPGPDLSAADYKRLLDQLDGRKVALVNAASASGAFVDVLSAPSRVVVTATRSGMERNETVFARFFADAYAGNASDADKNGKVSLLEAYTYAARETERWYKEQNRLMTEHAVLDDDGDGKGTAAPSGRAGDGVFANTFVLAGAPAAVATNPALRALYQEKAQLEGRIETLRGLKSKMDAAAYEKELEKLLVELALKNQAIKKAEGSKQ